MTRKREPKRGRVLVLSPHPDDEAIGCGGTLRGHVLAGDEVRLLFLTSGENGGHGTLPDVTAQTREAEARAAAEILGFSHVEFWRQPDGTLRANRKLVGRLQALIKTWRPQLIYVTHDAEMHPDHRAAARLVRRSLAASGRSRTVPVVRMYEVWTPLQHMDEVVDIAAEIETKLSAIRAYASQCRALRFDDAALGLNRYRGEMHCWPGGDYAEIFQWMRL
jgi:LmbE family N-acetylglucosaminyl deacetylase